MNSMLYVCGEALIDLVPYRDNQGDILLRPIPGGGPFNVACYCARFGRQVKFLSRISSDAFGESLITELDRYQVDTSLVQRGEEPTTLAVAAPGPDGSASYSFYVEGTADRLVSPELPQPPGPGDIFSFGTLSLALEPGASRYAQLLHTAADRGALITLDPNIRALSSTPKHREFLRSLLTKVTVLKLAEQEVDFLGEDVLRMVPVVVVTRGAEGATVVCRGKELQVPAVETTVVDTIGAGDTIMAVILSELDERGAQLPHHLKHWEKIIRRAVKEAALTCAIPGARR